MLKLPSVSSQLSDCYFHPLSCFFFSESLLFCVSLYQIISTNWTVCNLMSRYFFCLPTMLEILYCTEYHYYGSTRNGHVPQGQCLSHPFLTWMKTVHTWQDLFSHSDSYTYPPMLFSCFQISSPGIFHVVGSLERRVG